MVTIKRFLNFRRPEFKFQLCPYLPWILGMVSDSSKFSFPHPPVKEMNNTELRCSHIILKEGLAQSRGSSQLVSRAALLKRIIKWLANVFHFIYKVPCLGSNNVVPIKPIFSCSVSNTVFPFNT